MGGRIRLWLRWILGGSCVIAAAFVVVFWLDWAGLIWSCSTRLGAPGRVLAWMAVLHHVTGVLWLLLVIAYPGRWFGRRRRAFGSVLLILHGVFFCYGLLLCLAE